MPHSDPDLRMRIADKVKELGFIRASTLKDLKHDLGMSDVSNTQFSRALRSLQFKYPEMGVRVGRPHAGHPHSAASYMDQPPFYVRYVHEEAVATSV